MSIRLEYWNLIIPMTKLAKCYPGGLEKWKEVSGCNEPGASVWSDGELVRIGAMSRMAIALIAEDFKAMGLKPYSGRGDSSRCKDFCILTEDSPLTGYCDWLEQGEEAGTVRLRGAV